MSILANPPATIETLADVLDRLGNIALQRIRWRPYPGTATEQDVVDVRAQSRRLCELVDGTLVEKVMGYPESSLASFIIEILNRFVRAGNLGNVTGEAGTIRLFPGLVRIPDVAFVSWNRLPGRRIPTQPIPTIVPELVVEVLSPGNTAAEMERKRDEYFAANVLLVWMVDPEQRTIAVYTSPNAVTVLTEADTLDGGAVLPGFQVAVRDVFAELDRHG